MKKMYLVLLVVVLINPILALGQDTPAETRDYLARNDIQIHFYSALRDFSSVYERNTSTGSVTDHRMNWFMAGRAFAESEQFILEIQSYRRLLQYFMTQPEDIREDLLPSLKEKAERVNLAFSLMSGPLQTAHNSATWYSPTIFNSMGLVSHRDPKTYTVDEFFQLGNDLGKLEAFYKWLSGCDTTLNHEGRLYMSQIRAVTSKALADILLRYFEQYELDNQQITQLVNELGNFSGDFANMNKSLMILFTFKFEGIIVYDVFVNEIRRTLNHLIKTGGLKLAPFTIDPGATVEAYWKLPKVPDETRIGERKPIDARIARALQSARKFR